MMILKLLRVRHWVKNLFIFLPIFFSGELFDIYKSYNTLLACVAFSFIASFVYIINDIFDINFDKNHREKKRRPIASGKISKNSATIIGVSLLFIGLTILFFLSYSSFMITMIYVILNFLYSIKLKHIAIVDFVIVSLGFVIRIIIGSDVSKVDLTNWTIVLVFLLSLFLAVSKRRDDVYQFEHEKKMNRKVVTQYNLKFMDKILNIISSSLLVTYLLFITSAEISDKYTQEYLLITFVFVLIGVFRYNQISYVFNQSGSPVKILFTDKFLQIVIICWIATFFVIIYSTTLLT